MRVHADSTNLDDLLEYLRGSGCIALRLDDRTIEAVVPGASSPILERFELELYLKSWQTQDEIAREPMTRGALVTA